MFTVSELMFTVSELMFIALEVMFTVLELMFTVLEHKIYIYLKTNISLSLNAFLHHQAKR
jgi:hypothetical protein